MYSAYFSLATDCDTGISVGKTCPFFIFTEWSASIAALENKFVPGEPFSVVIQLPSPPPRQNTKIKIEQKYECHRKNLKLSSVHMTRNMEKVVI
jgi:hypothetical protein